MNRISAPGWRLAGAILSWVLFTFCFTLLVQATSVLAGLGGFCASGGPYVIETECPGSVIVFTPLSIIGMLVAVAIGFFLARGFAAPLIVWAWPILFVGLGIQFALSAAQPGGVTFGVLAVLFILMGLVPLVFEFRAGPRRIVVGKENLQGKRFRDREGAPRTFYAFGRVDPAETVPVTAADWGIALVVWIGSIAVGIWLGLQAFAAAAGA
jgi:hypothetical protein